MRTCRCDRISLAFLSAALLPAILYAAPALPEAISPAPSWVAESNQAFAEFGIFSTAAGDVNGDGYADVLIGARNWSSGGSQVGGAFLYLGGPAGLAGAPAWTLEGDQDYAGMGFPLGPAGDVNGDGYDDVVVASQYYSNGQDNEGRAWVYLGSPTGLSTTPAWVAEGNQVNAQFGSSVYAAGDVNGDGFGDLVIGAAAYSNGTYAEGAAFVYLGSASGLSTSPAWVGDAGQTGSYYGGWVAGAGDLNGDRYDDVVVGAIYYDNGQSNEGRAYVYFGSASGPSRTPDWIGEIDSPYANFGGTVAPAGDVNGDGYDDLIIGADDYTNGQSGEGGAFLYLGSPSGPSQLPDWKVEGNAAGAVLGWSGTAGDVNADGFDDVIVGAFRYAGKGAAWVYLGSPSGLAADPAWFLAGDQSGADYGYPVWTAGDVNGDGADDVIVGANRYSNGQSIEGRAYVYHGTPSRAVGIDVLPGSDLNLILLIGRHPVPVAILGSSEFDTGLVDRGSILFAGASPRSLAGSSDCRAVDFNRDGFVDLVCRFRARDLDLPPGMSTALLRGSTLTGEVFRGEDTVRVVGWHIPA